MISVDSRTIDYGGTDPRERITSCVIGVSVDSSFGTLAGLRKEKESGL